MVMLERAAEITLCFLLIVELEVMLFGLKNLLFLYEANWTLTLCNCLKALSSASLGTLIKISYRMKEVQYKMRGLCFYVTETAIRIYWKQQKRKHISVHLEM
jgi:hypothetical protein